MSDSKPSGTVCRHCGEAIVFERGYWREVGKDTRYCKEHDGRHEPASAEQPRLTEWDFDYPVNNRFENWPILPVATSPAEGPCQREHPSIFVQELSAHIDVEVLPLVRLLNAIPNVRTISSCQGDPGEIEVHGGSYGSVTFLKGSWREVSDFCFSFVFPLFIDLWDDVRVEVVATATHGEQWEGWIRFRNEVLPMIIDRLSRAAQPVPGAKVEEPHKDSDDVTTWNSTELLEHFESCCYDRRVDYTVRAELLRRLAESK